MPYPSSTQGNAIQRAQANGQRFGQLQQQSQRIHAAGELGNQLGQGLLRRPGMTFDGRPDPNSTQLQAFASGSENPITAGQDFQQSNPFAPMPAAPQKGPAFGGNKGAQGLVSVNSNGRQYTANGVMPKGARSVFGNNNPFSQKV